MHSIKTANFDKIVSFTNNDSGYECHIALQGIDNGPAIGGLRISQYPDTASALQDACDLATAMLKKAHVNKLPHGGGKAVIRLHDNHSARSAILTDYAEQVNKLNGDYITAIDVGTSQADMDIIRHTTPYVVCTSEHPHTAHYTALGVYLALKTSAQSYLNKSLNNLRFSVQGVGAVGSELIAMLESHSQNIHLHDTQADKLTAYKHLKIVNHEEIYTQPTDIFIPCALGGIINNQTIHNLNTKIICGAANNQLSATAMDAFIAEKGITYLPDFMVNAGGLIYASHMYHKNENQLDQAFNNLTTSYKHIISEARNTGVSPLKWLQTTILS